MTRVKLYRRGERCLVPDGEYLMAVSQGVDALGDWVPSGVQTFRTRTELKETLGKMFADADGISVVASPEFDGLASEMGLPKLTTEWGCL